jgi:trans-2,3-dihydro-3-hydroxyanthranilate isomerase
MNKAKRRLAMAQWDVFTANPLEGNSLAVFFDARGVSDAEMQLIAKEMNLGDDDFIIPRDPETERGRGIRVRIFTVQEELPFAGHPRWGRPLPCVAIPAPRKSRSNSTSERFRYV